MYRKWKSVAALGMAVLIGCSMPMGTMLAAEENPEAVQEVEADSASDTDAAYDDETVLDDHGNGDDEIDADDEKIDDEVNVEDENVDEEAGADDGIADEEGNADNEETADIAVMSVTAMAAEGVEVQASSAAPVIDIKWNNTESSKYDLGGQIDFKYVNNHDQAFVCSASQDGQTVSLYYYLDKVTDVNAEAKGTEKMESLSWEKASSSSERISLSEDARYVLYVKAVGADEQITYARSGGVVVDTIAPEVTKLVDGGTYPEGTEFQVVDANLESVKVNEVDVTSGWNAVYQVSANGSSSSCVIRLRDKAGNEKVYSINVSRGPAADNVISENGLYSLKKGVAYKLAAGKWQVGGDKSVYSGGNTFYVNEDGDFKFTKR